MRLAHPPKPARGGNRTKEADERIPSAPDSVGGVALEEATRSAREPKRSKRSKRAWLAGLSLAAITASLPLESRLREEMAAVSRNARDRLHSLLASRDVPARPEPTATLSASPPREEEPAREAPRFKPGRGALGGGVFSLPRDLRVGRDGTVDLLVHFHGNTDMVLESTEHAGVGAANVVVNLGVGSGPYEERFDNPVSFTDMLGRIPDAIERQGVPQAKIGRIALSSWSAGYGAILRILKNEGLASKIDAVILLDGLHVGYREDGSLNWQSIDPFQAFAARAIRGETLFVVTHSNIKPVDYLGVRETSDHLLAMLGMTRTEITGTTELPAFESFRGVLPKAEMIPLTPQTEARKGDFIVRGFRGNEPHVHMAHLMQMSEIGLADLARRWRQAAP